jgi:hypothetical protein
MNYHTDPTEHYSEPDNVFQLSDRFPDPHRVFLYSLLGKDAPASPILKEIIEQHVLRLSPDLPQPDLAPGLQPGLDVPMGALTVSNVLPFPFRLQ